MVYGANNVQQDFEHNTARRKTTSSITSTSKQSITDADGAIVLCSA
jgi:hypothetical protein